MTGLFEKPRMPEGSLKDLHGRVFYLKSATIRENIKTRYGVNDAVDLLIVEKNPETGEYHELLFSGFSAGIVQQVRRAQASDFPCFASIEPFETRNGTSTELHPREQAEFSGMSAEELRSFLEKEATTEADAHAEDDIPF